LHSATAVIWNVTPS